MLRSAASPVTSDPPPEGPTMDDAKEWAEDKVDRANDIYEDHGKVFRTMWIAVGFVVVAAGLAMIVFPGPVTVVVPLGLAMLAAVFGWARHLLMRSVEEGQRASRRFNEASRPVQALTVAGSTALAAAVVAWMVL
jgi:uncharacterized protein (TIGR02611 family)